MHWSTYEVFSILSGIAMLILAVVDREADGRNRAWAAVGGLFFIFLGLSGAHYFPRVIFFIPFATVGYMIYQVVKRKRGTGVR